MAKEQYFEKKIETVNDLIEFLYNHGVGESKQEVKQSAGAYKNVTLALMEIFKNLNFPLEILKRALACVEGNNVSKTIDEFLSFYCSYVNHGYLANLYEHLGVHKFEIFVGKLTNVQQILTDEKIKKNLYVTKVLTKTLKSQIKKQTDEANNSLGL